SMSELVDPIAAAVAEVTDTPYCVFGHCSGALTALELTRALRRLGVPPPTLLALTPYRHPTRFREVPRISDAEVESVRAWLFENVEPAVVPLLDDPEVFAMAERMMRADMRLVEDYR